MTNITKSLDACHCQTCRPITMDDMRMVMCPTCGNKRCPHANDHRNACTNSNEPGQPGSAYPARALRAALQDKAGEVRGERESFERWLGITPCGAAHDFGWQAWKARAAQPAPVVPDGWRIEMAPQWSETRLRVMPPGEPHYLLLEPGSMNEAGGVLYALCRAMIAASQQNGGSAG